MQTGGDDEGSLAVAKVPVVVVRRAFGVVSDTRRRRQPSDGVRLVLVFLGLVLIVALLDSGAGPELRVADALLPLPSPFAGAAEAFFWAAPALVALVCLVATVWGRRWAIVRDVALVVLASPRSWRCSTSPWEATEAARTTR